MIILLVSSWWILVSVFGGSDDIPRAIGPYPSQEMCRIAGEHLMPNDRQFWTAEKREQTEAREKTEAEKRQLEDEKYKAELAQIGEDVRGSKRKPGRIRTSRGVSEFDKNGTLTLETGWLQVSGSGTFESSPFYTALTPCVEIKDDKLAN